MTIENFLKGLIVGICNLIPGLSVGTVAVILKIFDKVIDSLSRENIKKNLLFLATLAVGIIIGTFAFSNVIQFLFDNYAMPTNYFFLGIVIGSIPMIYNKTKAGEDLDKIESGEIENKNKNSSSKYKWVFFVIAFIAMAAMVFMNDNKIGSDGNIITDMNITNIILLLLAGAFAAFAMVVPGVSGTFIMLILGVYPTVINALTTFDGPVIVIFATGCVIGMILSVKAIRYLLHHFYGETYAVILGLIVGSVFNFFIPITFDAMGLISVLLVLAGAALSYSFAKK